MLALAGASPAAAGATRYVDCSAHRAGDGTLKRPFNTLARASAAALRPGQRLLLRRGTTCTGTLAPSGSGTAQRPVVIGAYGRGARPHVRARARTPCC